MRLALQRNVLEFPSGVEPGFDPAHIAAVNPVLSVMALTGGAVDIRSGKPGTIVGVPTAGMDGRLGPVTKFTTTTGAVSFPIPTTNFNPITMAVIGRPTAVAASYQNLLTSSVANTGWRLYFFPTGNVSMVAAGVAEVNSGLIVTVNVPYFIAASVNATTANFVTVNLNTGQIRTATVAGTSSSGGDGTSYFGSSAFSQTPDTSLACGMISGCYLSPSSLAKWAEAPWEFWFPQTDARILQDWVGAAAAAAGKPTHFMHYQRLRRAA